jgi:hypothetical protein
MIMTDKTRKRMTVATSVLALAGMVGTLLVSLVTGR